MWLVQKGLKILKKNIIFDKTYWKINASHDGYLKKYNSIHEREIEFFPDQMVFVGLDKITKKTKNNYKFDIRFHVEPNVKLMKTQDNKTILIELSDEGGDLRVKIMTLISIMVYILEIKIYIVKIKIFSSLEFQTAK